MIPYVIHHVWVGGEMPPRLDAYVESWRHHHPAWEHRVWGNDSFGWLDNQSLFDDAESHTSSVGQFRSDIARYEILWRFGGVYVDTDMECLKPLDPLMDVEAFVAWETDDVWVNNAVIGACPGHPLIAACIERLPLSVRENAGARPNKLTGPQMLTPLVVGRDDVTIHDAGMFYPYRWDELDRQGEDFSGSFAVHHWDNARKRRGLVDG